MKDTTIRFAGVDWASAAHAVCVVDAEGTIVERFAVAHSARGPGELCRRLVRARVDRVAIERPDGPVVDALMGAGLEVVVIASRQVKALRERYGSAGNKDDAFDAYVLADCLRSDGHRLVAPRARRAGDGDPAGPCAGPQGPGRPAGRRRQPAARAPCGRLPRRGGALCRHRQPDQPALSRPLFLGRLCRLALRAAPGRPGFRPTATAAERAPQSSIGAWPMPRRVFWARRVAPAGR